MRPENLDDKNAHCRSHERTDFLIKCFDPGIVWDEHGIQSDVVISFSFVSSLPDFDATLDMISAIHTWLPTR